MYVPGGACKAIEAVPIRRGGCPVVSAEAPRVPSGCAFTGVGEELGLHEPALEGIDGINTGEWTPRELRHSFVSRLSDRGVPLEEISRLGGHSGTAVTEEVLTETDPARDQTGAVVMDGIRHAGTAAVGTREAVVTQIDTQTETRRPPRNVPRWSTCCLGCRGGGI